MFPKNTVEYAAWFTVGMIFYLVFSLIPVCYYYMNLNEFTTLATTKPKVSFSAQPYAEVNLYWTKVKDNYSSVSYSIFRIYGDTQIDSAIFVATVPDTFYTITDRVIGIYRYAIIAKDKRGNASDLAYSKVVEVVDNIPPSTPSNVTVEEQQ